MVASPRWREPTCSYGSPPAITRPCAWSHRGGRAIDLELTLEAWSEADPLNDRERQVLRLAGERQSASDIAVHLNLSHGTVWNYFSEAIGKLGVANRIEAYRLVRRKGWL